MPDLLNKQSIINLLIDSPLREPIKINLIDIVNNTNEPDLPKVYSTITKELEIFQKATERRMKLAEETISKLGGNTLPIDLPPLPTPPTPAPVAAPAPEPTAPPLSVPPLDLPPMPSAAPAPVATVPMPSLQPLGAPVASTSSDEDALAEIQKELDSLKTEAAADVAQATAPTV